MGQWPSSAFCRIEVSLRGVRSEHVGVLKLLLCLGLEPGGLEESSPCFMLPVLKVPGLSPSPPDTGPGRECGNTCGISRQE